MEDAKHVFPQFCIPYDHDIHNIHAAIVMYTVITFQFLVKKKTRHTDMVVHCVAKRAGTSYHGDTDKNKENAIFMHI